MGQVVGLLAVVFIGITVFAYAAVNIPYTFTSGMTAKASEVNANFQALATVMPAAKQSSSIADTGNFTTVYPTGTQANSITVTPPSSGKIILTTSGSVCIYNHTTGSRQGIILQLLVASESMTDTNISGIVVDIAGSHPTTNSTYPTGRVFSTLTALFVPSALP